jgi:predicted transcriptional regulator
MSALTIDVATLADSLADAVKAMDTGTARKPRHSFSSARSLMRTLGGKRFDLIQALSGAGPVTICEAARSAQRDAKTLHSDVQALLASGVLNKTADGRIEFGYEAVQVGFFVEGGVIVLWVEKRSFSRKNSHFAK